jgi:hypothetical protein
MEVRTEFFDHRGGYLWINRRRLFQDDQAGIELQSESLGLVHDSTYFLFHFVPPHCFLLFFGTATAG